MQVHSPVIDGLEKFEVNFGGPDCGQPQYIPLPALVSRDKEKTVMSRWKFTPEERAQIATGADLFLRIWTFGHAYPPTNVQIIGPVAGLSPSFYVNEFGFPLTQTEIDALQDEWDRKVARMKEPGNTISSPRSDVVKFADLMTQAMNSKHVERESREEPHYTSSEYSMKHAFDCLKDKIEQLEYHVQQGNKERAIKTAVHMANFCMVIAAKVEADQKL
jgi:hypothetical protein